jgi:hypothetical protein
MVYCSHKVTLHMPRMCTALPTMITLANSIREVWHALFLEEHAV